MTDKNSKNPLGNLPSCAADYIRNVIKKMRWQKKARADVQAELIGHFEDALKDCKTDEEKNRTAKEIISGFGDAKLIATLARRAKKRCRPLWQKILIHSFQALVIVFIYLSICGVYISSGKPNISINYVEWLNNYVQVNRDNSLNCAPLLKEAAELVVKMPRWLDDSNAKWPSDFNGIELEKLENWLTENSSAFDKVTDALKKPYYWSVYDTNESDFSKGGPFNRLMPTLSKYRKLAQAMNWEIRFLAYKNNTENALNKAANLCDMGHRMQGNGLLIEQLVGIAITAIGYDTILNVLDKTVLSSEQLEKMQQFLQQRQDDKVIDIQAEKACFYDFVQRRFTDDGKGGGKPIRQGIGFAGKNLPDLIFNILTFNLPSKKETIKKIDNIYDVYQHGFDVADMKNIEEQYNKATQNESLLLQILTPALGKMVILSWRVKTDSDGLIAALAILRYQKQTGKYPDNLEELLNKGFIKRMPFDAYRNGPMTYKKTEKGFTLYSFSNNFKDDGGDGTFGKWHDDGDAVFWPVAYPEK